MVAKVATSRIADEKADEVAAELIHEKWNAWPVNWTAIAVGTLAAMGALLVFGLIGTAIGAYAVEPDHRWVDVKKIAIGALIFSVVGAFFAFVIGGWVSGKIAGILRSEPGMLHGAIVWLAALPGMMLLAAVGAGSLWGGWHAGLAGSPSWAAAQNAPFDRPEALTANATPEERVRYTDAMTDYQRKVDGWKADTPKVTRNTALGAVTALLLGLVGAVLGGWLASGEPMNFSHYRTRKLQKQTI